MHISPTPAEYTSCRNPSISVVAPADREVARDQLRVLVETAVSLRFGTKFASPIV